MRLVYQGQQALQGQAPSKESPAVSLHSGESYSSLFSTEMLWAAINVAIFSRFDQMHQIALRIPTAMCQMSKEENNLF